MTLEHHTLSTVTVPVGLGGKTNPYVPDSAPTLLVDVAAIEGTFDAAELDARRQAAAEEAAAVLASAREEAEAVIAEAEARAESVLHGAEQSAATTLAQAEEMAATVETRSRELDERSDELDAVRADVDARSADLDARETELAARLAAVDEDAAEATRALAKAREDAGVILDEARETAEQIVEDARREAEAGSKARMEEAIRAVQDSDVLAQRIAELETVHRIEVQVLHDREVQLLDRIARLESIGAGPVDIGAVEAGTFGGGTAQDDLAEANSVRQSLATDPAETDSEEAHVFTPSYFDTTSDDPDVTEDVDVQDEDDRLLVSLDTDAAADETRRLEGRHLAETSSQSNGATRLATHAPLTEQLSITAFRSGDGRRGRRRR